MGVVHVVFLVVVCRVGVVSPHPPDVRYSETAENVPDSDRNYEMTNTVPYQSIDYYHQPMNDETPLATVAYLQPQPKRPMSTYKQTIINIIEWYESAIVKLESVSASANAMNTVSDENDDPLDMIKPKKPLSAMSVSELHAILKKMQDFYRATLKFGCCEFG